MKKFIAISLSLAMVFALFGAMTVSVSAETVTETMELTADQVDFIPGKSNTLTATKVIGDKENGDDFLVRFNMSSALNFSDKQFGISIPTSVFDLDVTKITYVLRANSTFKTNASYMYMTNESYLKSNQSSPTANSTDVVLYSNYNSISSDVAGSKKVIDLTVSGKENIKANKLNVMAFGRKNSSGDTTSASATQIDVLSITVEYQVEESSDPTITMQSGAAMRIDGTTNGIRFEATVDKTAFDELVSENATVNEIGTLIAKAGTDISQVVVDNAIEVKSSGQDIGDKIPVAKYAAGTTMQDVAGTDKYVIYGSLVGIDVSNATQQYVARAYVKYTDADGSHVLYAKDLSESRSIAQVAKAIVDANATDGYLDSLCDDHQQLVKDWAKYAE